jgi:quinolinate synthase
MLDENEDHIQEKGVSESGEIIQISPPEAMQVIDQQESEIQPERKKRKVRRASKLIMNLHYTQYPEVKKVARKLGFKVRNDDLNLLALAGSDATPGPI